MSDLGTAVAAARVRQGRILALGVLSAAALLTVAAMLAATAGTAAGGRRSHVSVYFVQGEQLAPVTRPGTTALEAVRQLIAGPTRAERGRGFRTYVPAATRVRSVSVANGIATVDLTEPFVAGTNPDTMLARLSELVRTLTGVQGATKVQLLVNGATTAGMFPGISTSNPITLRFLETPNVPVPQAARGEAPGARPGRQGHPAAADRARLPPPRRRRRPLRAGDAERDPRLPEMGAARPHRPARQPDEVAPRHRDAPRRRSPTAAPASAPRSCSTARSRS